MLQLLKLYFTLVVSKHASKLLSLEVVVALLVGGAVLAIPYSKTTGIASSDITVSEFARALSGYGSIGLGTCMTTLVLAARWAGSDFSYFLKEHAAGVEKVSDYGALLFKLSWTAIAHWVALLFGLLASLFAPKNLALLPFDAATGNHWIGAVAAFLFTYCIMLFLSTLLTVAVLCVTRKDFMESKVGETDGGAQDGVG